jgi:hypothetical protein
MLVVYLNYQKYDTNLHGYMQTGQAVGYCLAVLQSTDINIIGRKYACIKSGLISK